MAINDFHPDNCDCRHCFSNVGVAEFLNDANRKGSTLPEHVLKAAAGVKYDNGKPRLSLLPSGPMTDIARVMGFGAAKYTDHNWRGGMAWSRLIDASLRHITAFNDGEDTDPESGLPHLAHAGCCIIFLLEYMKTHKSLDDRYKHPIQDT